MERRSVPFQKIVFVCVNQREPHEVCCANRDSVEIARRLKQSVKERGVSRYVRVSKSGCQDVCSKGPNVMIFPDNIWYHGVKPDNADQILEEILGNLNIPSATKPPSEP
jgi:(2Fe-2S) ferredoxin